ncbi:MAG: TIGR04348 family glycosyltransferase [Candidatus Eremiobacteraeota bacterium]|nr:TIGR04348 family glycosyltransferase [Candidatus Eremiobacteraeota bacterium]
MCAASGRSSRKRRSPARRLRIGIVSPARIGSTLGNSVTAERYAQIFRTLGLRAEVVNAFKNQDFDILVALHAHKSGPSALAFRRRFPKRPLIVVLTGTDLYRDIHSSRLAQRALRSASALVVLQHSGISELPRDVRAKTHSITQSASAARVRRRAKPGFDVCVIGHLRWEKDPLRTAYALRRLRGDYPIRVTHVGKALTSRFALLARREQSHNPRYRWVGERNRAATRKLLASSDLMVISSRLEGGANTVCEAIAAGVPIIASRIPGNEGLLGRNYPGYYRLGDTHSLTLVLERAITDRRYYLALKRGCARLKGSVSLARERNAWQRVIASLRSGPLNEPLK